MTPSPIVREYSAEDADTGALSALPRVFGYPGLAWRHRSMVRNMFRSRLLGRFRGSYLGVFWVLVHPIFLFLVYYAVFGILFATSPRTGEEAGAPFAFYLFAGVLAWTSFQESTIAAVSTVTGNGNLVKKVVFPCELLPLPTIMVSLVVYFVGAAVLLIAGTASGALELNALLLAWPLVLLVQVLFTLGVGLFLGQLNVFMRDTAHLYGILSTAWFFGSPIFWSIELIEGKFGDAAFYFKLNPMYSLLQCHRQVLGLGSEVPEPFLQNLGGAAAWAVVAMVLGYSLFMSRKHKFADLV